MEDTTYTARSAENPQQVVTFILDGRSVMVDIGVSLEHVERTIDKGKENAPRRGSNQPSSLQWNAAPGPLTWPTLAPGSKMTGSLAAWVRTGGLRLVPITFIMNKVDNPDAAEAFAEEVRRRKEIVDRPGRFPGLLDYWASWIFGGALMVGLLAIWMWTQKKEKEFNR